MNPRSIFLALSILLLPFLSMVSAAVPGNWAAGNYAVGDLVIYDSTTYIATQSVSANEGNPTTATAYWSSLDALAGTKSTPTGQPTTTPDTSSLSNLSVPSDSNDSGGTGGDSTASSFFGISCRAYIDDAPMVGGLTINGTQAKKVMIRIKGPSMASALPGKKLLANPKISILKYDATASPKWNVIETSFDYGDHSSATEYADRATGNNLEPMIVTSLDPGVYSIKVQDEVAGESGNANLEIYEVDDDSSSSLFFGISGRAYIDDAPMVGGLTINGTKSKKVMIRIKGPSMASALPGKKLLANPKISILKYDASASPKWNVIETSFDYGDHSSAAEYADRATGNNLEPMIVTSLDPGVYSIKVQDEVVGESGNANLEIYEVE